MNPTNRILFVDDSPQDTILAIEALSACNLAGEVIALRDGSLALDYLYRRGDFAERKSSQPAVILLDLKMPKVDGLEALKIIKRDPDLKTIPVVMLTSSEEESDVLQSYQLGANAYVVKPMKFPDFVQAVRELGTFWAIRNESPTCSGPSLGRG